MDLLGQIETNFAGIRAQTPDLQAPQCGLQRYRRVKIVKKPRFVHQFGQNSLNIGQIRPLGTAIKMSGLYGPAEAGLGRF